MLENHLSKLHVRIRWTERGTEHLHHDFILTEILDLERWKARADRDKMAAVREQVVSHILSIFSVDGIENQLDRFSSDLVNYRRKIDEVGGVTIDYVRSAERFQVVGMFGGCIGDDGTKSGEFEQLNG